WGLSNAAATMAGQAVGARNPGRADPCARVAPRGNGAVLGTLGGLFVTFAPAIVALFAAEVEGSEVAVRAPRIASHGLPLYAFGMVLSQAFNGAGDTWTPTWLNLAVFWTLEIPLAWFLARGLELGADGAFWAITVAFSVLAGAAALVWRRGRWRTREV